MGLTLPARCLSRSAAGLRGGTSGAGSL